MAKLPILHFPDPRLRRKAKPVEKVDADIQRLLDDMLETMYDAPGIGLAAVQVNVPLRVVVIDVSEEHDQPLCLVNPVIVERRGTEEMDEGCLSVPGFYEPVERSEWVRVRALGREGEPLEIETDGLLAVCIQHELDHLDGITMFERCDPMARIEALRDYEIALAAGARPGETSLEARVR